MTFIATAGGAAISTPKTSISCMLKLVGLLLSSLLDYYFQARTFEMSPCNRWAVNNNLSFQIQGLLKAMTDQEVWGQELSDHPCILTDFPQD